MPKVTNKAWADFHKDRPLLYTSEAKLQSSGGLVHYGSLSHFPDDAFSFNSACCTLHRIGENENIVPWVDTLLVPVTCKKCQEILARRIWWAESLLYGVGGKTQDDTRKD